MLSQAERNDYTASQPQGKKLGGGDQPGENADQQPTQQGKGPTQQLEDLKAGQRNQREGKTFFLFMFDGLL